MVGHIKLDRKIIDWEWYSDVNVSHLFIYLILKANFKDGKWRGILVKRGQLITGRLKVSKDTGLSEMQIRTCLNKLKITKEISTEVTNRFTIITICKYDTYQSSDKEDNQQNNRQVTNQLTNSYPTDNQQVTTIEEELRINKNDNKESEFKNYMPKVSDFNGLPEVKIGASIELVRITKRVDIDTKNVQDLWSVFKIQNLTGKKYYADEDAVYSHFINWIKTQNFKEIKKDNLTSVKKDEDMDYHKYLKPKKVNNGI